MLMIVDTKQEANNDKEKAILGHIVVLWVEFIGPVIHRKLDFIHEMGHKCQQNT